jgi:hypothetical protein
VGEGRKRKRKRIGSERGGGSCGMLLKECM